MNVTDLSSNLLELATVYYACRDTEVLLKTFAGRMGTSLGARAVLVWLAENSGLSADPKAPTNGDGSEEEQKPRLKLCAAWFAAGERIETAGDSISEGLPLEVFVGGEMVRYSAQSDDEVSLAHLASASVLKVKTGVCCALPGTRGSLGVVEILNLRNGAFTREEERFVTEAGRITALALESRLAEEGDQQDRLVAIERLTLLYDISRTFTSTLELEELLPVIADKIRDIMQAQACNLWLADPEAGDLYAVQQAGEDPTVGENARCAMGEGAAGKAAKSGQGVLIENAAEEELLAERRKGETEEFHLESVMCVPLLKDEEVIGAVEVINRREGEAFEERDLFFLSNICEQAAVAIHNANLLKAERKVSALDALLNISREITSTLDLDHVLTTVVHHASTVVPFDRCAIGLFDRDRFLLGAVSGEKDVPKTPEMTQLRDILGWVASRKEPVSIHQYEDGWHADPEDAKGRAAAFLEAQGYSGFYALPLRDDQGAIGAVALMHSDAEFLNESEQETLSILANQTAVAIRNAQLYQQVPLAGFLKPLAERKQKLLAAMPKAHWMKWAWRAAAVLALLVVIPMPMRIGTNASVVPGERRIVTAEAGGIAERVLIHEGSIVHAGDLLAVLDSSADQLKLAQARTSLAIAQRALGDAEFQRDPAAAGQARIQVQLYQAETQLEQKRVDEARLIAPISGVVVTPRVEQKVGTMLAPGEMFCELVDEAHMAVTMNVHEADLPLLRVGAPVRIKLNSLPVETLHGTLDRIGAMTQSEEGEQFFVVRANFDNPRLAARDGMVGKAKILAGGGWFSSGWYPLGYVIFRTPMRWGWEKAWSWLP
ncbi:MAG TPA: GAF domain-containing protein [Terriglobales bacterium]|nr:GAF domain-containing protein [Terriglobales bacterium]